ncbi:hypothetical protein L914_11393 [Phytophthora nicotianae]|uniref:Uncharacterized protein n=1 Tax=Phytophthora nicotianae TaxID=4792 RepID=W2N588_PHYNI|nr:hypothetical protein L914_11393 [Phytophthora nicotianae]
MSAWIIEKQPFRQIAVAGVNNFIDSGGYSHMRTPV